MLVFPSRSLSPKSLPIKLNPFSQDLANTTPPWSLFGCALPGNQVSHLFWKRRVHYPVYSVTPVIPAIPPSYFGQALSSSKGGQSKGWGLSKLCKISLLCSYVTLTRDSTSVHLGFLICGKKIKIIPSPREVVRMTEGIDGICSVEWYERAVKGKDSRSESDWVRSSFNSFNFLFQLFQLPLRVT